MAKRANKESKGYAKKRVKSEAANQQLKAYEQRLKAANQQLWASEEDLKQTNHRLGERVKELNCLYGLSQLAERGDIALEEIFQGLAELIPPSWQYPEITAARITFEGRRFKTSNFRKTTWIQSADIKVHGQKAGSIEVCYLKKRLVIDEGPFLKEERSLLNALAERMGSIIERKQAEEALYAANQQLDASNQQLRASKQQLKADNQQLAAGEKELHKQMDFLNTTIESLNHPFTVIDVNDYTVKLANLAANRAKVTGETTCYAMMHERDKPCGEGDYLCPIRQIKKTKRTVTLEHVHSDKDGNPRNIEVHGHPIFDDKGNVSQIIEYCIDITERKKAEEVLRKQKAELQIILDSAPAGIWYKDTKNRFVRVNKAAADSIGKKPEDIEGKSAYDLFPEEAEKYYRDDIEVIKSGKPKWGIIERLQILSGEKRWVHTDKVPYCDEQGNVVGIIAFIIDITERKQAEEALEAANQQLDASNQQLRASKQQLKADNQQLVAKEQQLKAANQQLKASEQQLKAANQQLRANEEALQKARDELEQRVKERTAELTNVNKKLRMENAERKRAERKIVQYQERLRSLSYELSKTEEQTRRHVAEILHDDSIQTLIFLKMKFDDLRGLESPPEFAKTLDEIDKQTDDLIQRMRTLTSDLSSPMLYDLGLAAAIKEWLTREIQGRYGISTEFEDDGKAKPLDEDLRILLYRAVRELLTNVVKHAKAKSVKLSKKKQGERIVITIEDDGKGFAVPKDGLKYDTSGGFGLFTINEHLKQYDGSLKIEPGSSGGTRVVLSVPLKTVKGQ